MNDFYYIHYTSVAVLVSLIVLIAITLFCIVKRKFKIIHGTIVFVCLFVIYFFIPLRLCIFRCVFKHPEQVETILKFSINPYEKRVCYKYLAQIYKNQIYNNKFQNIDKAIYCMEKAINGNYMKYKEETIILAHWYSIKGDWSKTIELNNLINNTKGASLRNAYIMEDEYQKAIDAYSPKNNSPEEFLMADLYKKVKNYKEANIYLNKAQKVYNSNLNKITAKLERAQYIEKVKKYKTVDNYKEWLKKKCLEFSV